MIKSPIIFPPFKSRAFPLVERSIRTLSSPTAPRSPIYLLSSHFSHQFFSSLNPNSIERMSAPSDYRPRRKKKMKESEFHDEDRISKLPDPLLHHIFSLLDMKFVIQSSVLSRRWRYLWISQSILNFIEEFHNSSNQSVDLNESGDVKEPNNKSFMEFIKKVLFLRNASKIHTFRLICKDDCHGRSVPLDVWMPILVRRKLEMLDLQIDMSKNYSRLVIPDCFFECRSLTTLKLDFGSKKVNKYFRVPDDISEPEFDLTPTLTKLKTIHLRSVWGMRGDCGLDDLICMCPKLETLVIDNRSVKSPYLLDISHRQLKNLEIQTNDRHSISLLTPRLRSFTCRDYKLNEYHFARFSVNEAVIDTDYYWRPPPAADVFHCYSLPVRCLDKMRHVKSLTLSAWLLEIAVEDLRDFGILEPYRKLTFLVLKTSLSTSQINAILRFFDICPNLETLVLKMTEPPLREYVGEVKLKSAEKKKDSEEDEYDFMLRMCEPPPGECLREAKLRSAEKEKKWEQESEEDCDMDDLKCVKIWDIQGSVNELQFFIFLLKNATALEKIIFYTSKKQSSINERDLNRFGQKLKSFPAASSRVKILFL